MAGMTYTHMTFFWGTKSAILFTGWPGASKGYYALGLIFVFVLAFLVEWLSGCRLIKPGRKDVTAALVRTFLHTIRTGLANLLMLALMSFNGGVFIAAVAGHAVGFLLFRSRRVKNDSETSKNTDLPPQSCC